MAACVWMKLILGMRSSPLVLGLNQRADAHTRHSSYNRQPRVAGNDGTYLEGIEHSLMLINRLHDGGSHGRSSRVGRTDSRRCEPHGAA